MNEANIKENVSLIIPVYNEEKTVGDLVSYLSGLSLFKEVICVNDGSQDNSLSILQNVQISHPEIQIVNLEPNRGKGYALSAGIERAGGKYLIFLDADLYNLTKEIILKMLEPVLSGRADAVVGFWGDGYVKINLLYKISGQRVYKKADLLPLLPRMKESRYGVEVLLNEAFKDKRVEQVRFEGVGHLNKHQKRNPVDSVKEYIQEGVEIALEIGEREVFTKEDLKILNKLSDVIDLSEVKVMVSKLENKYLKKVLEDYFKRYLEVLRIRK